MNVDPGIESDWSLDRIAWDDVNDVELPVDKVRAARKEESIYMMNRRIWDLRTVEEAWRITGRAPVSTRWVDTDKGCMGDSQEIRSRMVARDFKGGDKDRDDLFAETPPLEAKRLLLSDR